MLGAGAGSVGSLAQYSKGEDRRKVGWVAHCCNRIRAAGCSKRTYAWMFKHASAQTSKWQAGADLLPTGAAAVSVPHAHVSLFLRNAWFETDIDCY
jgi:hypothetical protein